MPETAALWNVQGFAEVLLATHQIAAMSPEVAEREALARESDRQPTRAEVTRVAVGPDRKVSSG
jgi:hypothetical protein